MLKFYIAFLLILYFHSYVDGSCWLWPTRRYCQVSSWSSWTSCSVSCGYGTKYRSRRITVTAKCRPCNYNLRESTSCWAGCCPRACSYYYGSWSKCSGCGKNGKQYSKLVISSKPSCKGKECPKLKYKTRKCDTKRYNYLFLRYKIYSPR